ncbi:hypothetical protein SO802_020140 [Lithocarpus litseifolius]|uniref:Uncharacterized protein n=1 Tax=Lithocarpus litseifolius TaxID=425828 RepID=A0AAW2CB36_9ROSI
MAVMLFASLLMLVSSGGGGGGGGIGSGRVGGGCGSDCSGDGSCGGSGRVCGGDDSIAVAGEGNELERLLPEEDSIASSSSLAERPFSNSEDSDDFWKAYITSSSPVDEVTKANNGFIPRSKHVSMAEDSVESGKDESSKLSNSSKPESKNGKESMESWPFFEDERPRLGRKERAGHILRT